MKIKNLNDMWLNSVLNYPDRTVIGRRHGKTVRSTFNKVSEKVKFVPTSYEELEREVQAFGQGLLTIGLNEGDAVGVIAENSMRWIICDLAVLGNRAFNVPRGISATLEEIQYILNHSESKMVIVENQEQLNRVLSIRSKLEHLNAIIVIDEEFKGGDTVEKIYSFEFLMSLGRDASKQDKERFSQRRVESEASDIATLMYTSGTTGTPKGIPLTHANIMHNVEILPDLLMIDCYDKFLSVLPIWHILERTIEYVIFRAGASIWYSHKITFLRDFKVVQPTFLASVPRLWMLVYNRVMSKVARKGIRSKLFHYCYQHSLKVLRARRYKYHQQYLQGDEPEYKQSASLLNVIFNAFADFFIYRKIRNILGKQFIAAISGASSLPEYIDDFFSVVGISLLEGYGLTETSPVLCVRTFAHNIPFTVGKPLAETIIKVMDENGQEVNDGEKGVVWVSGPQVFKEYYKNPEETEKVIKKDSNGVLWFNTGDLGRKTKYGDISILGRVKDTIVLISGENIEPAKIESTIVSLEPVEQVMVCGQDQEYLTALIVPNEEYLLALCKDLNVVYDLEKIHELSFKDEIKNHYMHEIKKIITYENGFKDIEHIRNIAFTFPFSVEDGTLTNTMKVRRHVVALRDEQKIVAMYPRYNNRGKVKVA